MWVELGIFGLVVEIKFVRMKGTPKRFMILVSTDPYAMRLSPKLIAIHTD